MQHVRSSHGPFFLCGAQRDARYSRRLTSRTELTVGCLSRSKTSLNLFVYVSFFFFPPKKSDSFDVSLSEGHSSASVRWKHWPSNRCFFVDGNTRAFFFYFFEEKFKRAALFPWKSWATLENMSTVFCSFGKDPEATSCVNWNISINGRSVLKIKYLSIQVK